MGPRWHTKHTKETEFMHLSEARLALDLAHKPTVSIAHHFVCLVCQRGPLLLTHSQQAPFTDH